MNTFEFEHADLGGRAAWRGKAAHLAAGSQDPMARDDQRHRIFGHGLADISRRFWAGAELFCQCAIGRRMTPADTTRRGVDLLEELVLAIKVEPEPESCSRNRRAPREGQSKAPSR